MSYLTQYAVRPGPAPPSVRRGVRVDLDLLLNRPQFDGGASVRAFVEDTSCARRLWRRIPSPRLVLRISDCTSEIALEFSVDSHALRENSLHKIDTLLDALHEFRGGLAAEAELHAARERS
jgi:hypothetical protein